ncbi:hypothetical protein ILUMI_05579 [Ignelater luminosus]|uniref:Kinesin motor domain-containing protein n=1 Tax=Ignelater luminosus TaxID=2038154 RepID=A0A8K0DHE6_IGNLU|nr:hypothetical protein ILUMI_05579 [Ignelater luminosus]
MTYPVQVFCRLRTLPEECQSCVKLLSPTTLALSASSKIGRKECNYIFKHIFTSYTGQQEVFEHVALPLLEDLVKGKNGLLFTYGATGSGKTYTLTGEPSMPGIMPRCIGTLFNSIADCQAQKFLIKSDRMNGFEVQGENDALEDRLLEVKMSTRKMKTVKRGGGDVTNNYENDGTKLRCVNENNLYAVFVSYTEVYNNTVYDLLDETSGKVLQAKIIREDSQKRMYVNGVVEVEVKSAADAFELFCIGQKRKHMGHTILNAESSRRQLSLVDLAGSERCSRTQNTGMRLKEASSINNSLMSLRTCLEILRENQLNAANKLVPYRDSRLTLLFKNYFEGEGNVRMIVCINPSIEDCEENLQVLKFAEMTQDVKTTKAESRYTPYKYKTPSKTAKQTLSTQTSATSRIKKVASFLPKIPSVKLDMENPHENIMVLDSLTKVLHARRQKRERNWQELAKREQHFRKRLLHRHQDSVLTKSEICSLKALLKKEKQTNRKLNIKITDLETSNENLLANNKEFQDTVRTLQNTIDEKTLRINQNHLEREKAKQKLVLQSEKMNQELDEKLRQQRACLQTATLATEAKIQKIKNILESDTMSACASEQEVEAPVQPEVKIVQEMAASAITIPAPRNRRSRSAGEVWLEHNVIKPVALGTVLQPSMKKRKSVNKLKKASDVTNPRQNKYCLLAQEADAGGELETKLYKGDIVQTCGGGAQVIFNDVECLRQESPTSTRIVQYSMQDVRNVNGINQNRPEREKAKQKLALQSEKMNQQLDEKLQKQCACLQAAMPAKERH